MSAVDSQPRRVAQAEWEAQEALERLRQTSLALLEANQSLAQLPLLEFRLEEAQRERERLGADCERLEAEAAELRAHTAQLEQESARLAQDAADARARADIVETSRSWRLLAPLRRLRAAFRRRG